MRENRRAMEWRGKRVVLVFMLSSQATWGVGRTRAPRGHRALPERHDAVGRGRRCLNVSFQSSKVPTDRASSTPIISQTSSN
jgi:hypothetical protein